MSSNIPEKINYFDIEFTRDMKIDTKEVSLRNSIFSRYDADKNGEFNDTEWQVFTTAVEQENQMRQRLSDKRNSVTVSKYKHKIKKAQNKIKELIEQLESCNNFRRLEKFLQQHQSCNVQALADGETPPEGAEIFDISAFEIGYQLETGKCYQRGYIVGAETLSETELAELREILSTSRENKDKSDSIMAQIQELSHEIDQYTLLASMAEEGALDQTQTDYQNQQIYQTYQTRIRSDENPFWQQINELETQRNSLMIEYNKTSDSTRKSQIQQQVGQIEDQLKQLDKASLQWFIGSYGGGSVLNSPMGGSDITQSGGKGGKGMALSPGSELGITPEVEMVNLPQDPESDEKIEPELPQVNPEAVVTETETPPENPDADPTSETETQVLSEEEIAARQAFLQRMSGESIRSDALQASIGGGSSTNPHASVSVSSQNGGLASSLSSSYNIRLQETHIEDISRQLSHQSDETGTSLKGDDATSVDSGSESGCADSGSASSASGESSDKTASSLGLKLGDGCGDNITQPDRQVFGITPTSFENTLAAGLEYVARPDDDVSVTLSANGEVSTTVSGENNLMSSATAVTSISVAGEHDSGSLSTTLSGSIQTNNDSESSLAAPSPLTSVTSMNYTHHDDHLDISAGGTLTITGIGVGDETTTSPESISIVPQGNLSLRYNRNRFSLQTYGSFSLSETSSTTNGNISVTAGRFNFSSSYSNYSLTIPSLGADLSDLGGTTSTPDDFTMPEPVTNTNTNFTSSAHYGDGNWDASLGYELSATNGDQSHTGTISARRRLDRSYVGTSIILTNISQSYSLTGGSQFISQPGKGTTLSLTPSGSLGYSVGDQAIISDLSVEGSYTYNTDNNTRLNISLTDSFKDRSYINGGLSLNNMLILNGSATVGHLTGNVSLTHSYIYNHTTPVVSEGEDAGKEIPVIEGIDILESGSSSDHDSRTQSLTLGAGLSYTGNNVTFSAHGDIGLGNNPTAPTFRLGVVWNLNSGSRRGHHTK